MEISDENIVEALSQDRLVRQAVTRQSHLMFFLTYLSHYIRYPLAEFHKDILRLTEDVSNKLACIVAFRGSGKSTLVTLSYVIWSILGIQQKKFVLIICQTQAQAKQQMANLKHELENNKLLKSDLGPFREDTSAGEWAISSLIFQNTGARIMIASTDQSIRGIRHHEYRPDLIILDDIEDLNSVKTIEGRNKVFDWFTREIIPLGDMGTRTVIVGNLLHEDSLMMRLKRKIIDKNLEGVFYWFPLLDEKGQCLWTGKFDTPEKITQLKQSVANELAWQQEYLLEIISDSTRVIWPQWIHRYDYLPKNIHTNSHAIFISVDLAISQKEYSDYTSIVIGALYGIGKEKRIYIFPNPINKRMGYPETIETIKSLAHSFKCEFDPKVIIESNGFQQIYADQLKQDGLDVLEIKNTSDKRTRLALTSTYIQSGLIQFPKEGGKELIDQLTGFGIENHDDLADAFSMMILNSINIIQDTESWEDYIEFLEENNGAWIDFH